MTITVQVYSARCGPHVCSSAHSSPAGRLREGDTIYVAHNEEDARAASITSVTRSSAHVRYLLTDSSFILVGAASEENHSSSKAFASVCSTALCHLETLPFRLLDGWLLQLPAVQASLSVVLDSPLLSIFEVLLGAGVSKSTLHSSHSSNLYISDGQTGPCSVM